LQNLVNWVPLKLRHIPTIDKLNGKVYILNN